MPIRPLRVEKTSASELTIAWEDGHASVFPYAYLRAACPCAMCVGNPGGKAFDPAKYPNIRPLDMGPVGRYAMSFAWSDGHSTGIYSWEYLRRICPCSACQGEDQ